jgi:hypothetical protein
MSDHAWFLENIASHLAGGLDPAEAERFNQHAAACESCARALEEARDLDRTIDGLFADARPRPELEDRMVRAVRARGRRSSFTWPARLSAAAAAVLVLGVVGAAGSRLIDEGELRFPGTWGSPERDNRALAENHLKQMVGSMHSDKGGEGAPAGGDIKGVREDTPVMSGFSFNSTSNITPLESDSPPRFGEKAQVDDKWRERSKAVRSRLGDLEDDRKSDPKAENKPAAPEYYYSYVNAQEPAKPAAPAATPPPAARDEPGAVNPYRQVNPGVTDNKAGFGFSKSVDGSVNGLKDAEKAAAGDSAKMPPGQQGQQGSDGQKPNQLGNDAQKPDTSGQGKNKPGPDDKAGQTPPAANPRKIVIRSGEVTFEVDSFDAAVATVTRLVAGIKDGFVATVNSEKLANGKVRGTVVVRVPPERLDGLVLDLRKELGKTGELRSQRIGSQDITKQYTDLESRLRAARAMEERLLQIIKTGKGEIKDLLAAEKELGVWRTRIEEIEGELRYYANQVGLSTLSITLVEKEIRSPFEISATEQVRMNIEVEDVEKAQKDALAAVAAAKGRITRSELKQQGAGQLSAVLEFEVSPEAAAAVRDRLKQLGQVVVFDLDRLQKAEGGSGPAAGAKLKQHDTRFAVTIYNLAGVAPRETVTIQLAAVDAEAAYKEILERIQKSAGRVLTSNLARPRSEQTKGTIDSEVRTAEADAFLKALKDQGEVVTYQVSENPDAPNVTRSKRRFLITVHALGALPPRETSVIQLAARDVAAGYRALQQAVLKPKGRILLARLNEHDRQNVTAQLNFEVLRQDEGTLLQALAAAGDVLSRNVTRAQETETAIDSKVRLDVEFISSNRLKPREQITLGLEVTEVEKTAAAFTNFVTEAGGRVPDSRTALEPNGRVTAQLVFDVPLASADGLVEKFKAAGTVRVHNAARNPQVPDGKLAIARLDVTLTNGERIVPSNEGVWPQVRKGLSTSFVALSWSLTVVIIGVCFVLPWALVLYAAYVIVRRFRRNAASATPPA